ncbi:MAG: peptidyl-prolyl cis-trans isomerase [Planctomycetota bacterium]|nr:MAG: peptidyl-prolyl cis-trans isomerase [Planctomycetota bacterium]
MISNPDRKPQVEVVTNFGTFTIELDAERAPQHVVNFLWHVDRGFYNGLLFHRSACTPDPDTGECVPFVLQGGGFRREDGELVPVETTRDPVPSEADNGLSNSVVYSVALALLGNDPDSGRTEFFINLSDNAFLDDLGFTVFGMVVAGTEVVDSIAALERTDSPVIPGEVSLPVEDVIMEEVRRVNP